MLESPLCLLLKFSLFPDDALALAHELIEVAIVAQEVDALGNLQLRQCLLWAGLALSIARRSFKKPYSGLRGLDRLNGPKAARVRSCISQRF